MLHPMLSLFVTCSLLLVLGGEENEGAQRAGTAQAVESKPASLPAASTVPRSSPKGVFD